MWLNIFSSFVVKDLEGDMLPPARGALLPRIMRANVLEIGDKSYTMKCPELPPIDQNA